MNHHPYQYQASTPSTGANELTCFVWSFCVGLLGTRWTKRLFLKLIELLYHIIKCLLIQTGTYLKCRVSDVDNRNVICELLNNVWFLVHIALLIAKNSGISTHLEFWISFYCFLLVSLLIAPTANVWICERKCYDSYKCNVNSSIVIVMEILYCGLTYRTFESNCLWNPSAGVQVSTVKILMCIHLDWCYREERADSMAFPTKSNDSCNSAWPFNSNQVELLKLNSFPDRGWYWTRSLLRVCLSLSLSIIVFVSYRRY